MTGLTPDIIAASVVRHGLLRLTFADGLTGEVDVLDRMCGPVFERARTPAGFAEVKADSESGTVAWPGGADLAPDTLYERIRTGLWPDESAAASRPRREPGGLVQKLPDESARCCQLRREFGAA